MILGSTQTAIGWVILFITLVAAAAYAFINTRAGRAETGSEVELAPNRKPYYSDEELEGVKLDRTLTFGIFGIFLLAVGLPLYWLAEPGRQDGAVEEFKTQFGNRGAALFETTENGGYNCAFCHGGMDAQGSEVDYTITDANGQFVKQVKWKAPALDAVLLRYSREEVRYILTYGRPFSPMPPFGTAGGGPMNQQQLQNIIDYLETIQLTPEQSQAKAEEGLAAEKEAAEAAGQPYANDGEALFNLGYYSGFAGGAYSCGRCHTTGWSYDEKGPDGNGAFGPALRGGATLARFPGAVLGFEQHADFVCTGSVNGQVYGVNGQGTGRMPGFCQTPGETAPIEAGEVGVITRDPTDPDEVGGMLSKEMVEAIVEYERSL